MNLSASTGGVCVLIGTTYCTCMPDNDEDGGIIQQAIANIYDCT